MKTLHLLATSATMAALLIVAASEADAQMLAGAVPRDPPPVPGHHGGGKHGKHHGFGGGIWIVEREVPVIIERDVVREVLVEPALPAPPSEPREPYVIGKSYASLPGGCMKLIEGGASYYFCGGGEWYRLSGKVYRAVARP